MTRIDYLRNELSKAKDVEFYNAGDRTLSFPKKGHEAEFSEAKEKISLLEPWIKELEC